jgi:hypothetical protein
VTDVEYLQSGVLRGLVEMLMQDRALDAQQALRLVRGSLTFEHLMDAETGFYRESAAHVYEHLREELGEQGRYC